MGLWKIAQIANVGRMRDVLQWIFQLHEAFSTTTLLQMKTWTAMMTHVTCLGHQLCFFFVEAKTLSFASKILNMKQWVAWLRESEPGDCSAPCRTWTWTWPPCNPRHGQVGHGRRDETWSIFLVGFVDRECYWCFFLQVFFPWCGNCGMIFGGVFFPMKSFGHPLVIGIPWQAMLSASDSMSSIPVSTSPWYSINNAKIFWVTAIRIDCQTAFYLHPNIEFYLFLADSTLRISRDQVCAQVSTYQDLCIRHSWLELPIAALIPLLTPILILPRCPSRNRSKELMMTWIQRLEA